MNNECDSHHCESSSSGILVHCQKGNNPMWDINMLLHFTPWQRLLRLQNFVTKAMNHIDLRMLLMELLTKIMENHFIVPLGDCDILEQR